MKRGMVLLLGTVLAICLGMTEIRLSADDPNCRKLCGVGGTVDFGTRSACEGDCNWVECTAHNSDCGYSDNFNDFCGFWIPCDGPNAQ